MNLEISYRHMDSTEAIESKIKEKADHLTKYIDGMFNVRWVCGVENGRHHSEVHIHHNHQDFHAHSEGDNLYHTFDEVLQKISKQLRENKKKVKDKIHRH